MGLVGWVVGIAAGVVVAFIAPPIIGWISVGVVALLMFFLSVLGVGKRTPRG